MLAKLKSTYLEALPRRGQPAHRPHPHRLSPGRGRDRAPVLDRAEPAEHPDPHRDRPLDPRRVRAARGCEILSRRLLADRAARAGAPERRRELERRVPRRHRRARAHRARDLRRAEEMVTRDMRGQAKTVNYAVIYGQTQFALARNLRSSAARPRATSRRSSSNTPASPRYMQNVVAEAAQTGQVRDVVRAAAQDARPAEQGPRRRQAAERVARNTPIQGSAADIIKLAMIAIQRELEQEARRARCCSPCTTSWCSRRRPSEKAELERIVVAKMERAAQLPCRSSSIAAGAELGRRRTSPRRR